MNNGVLDQNQVLQNWQLIVAFLNPLALSVIIQSGWARKLQAVVAFAFCAVVTVVGAWLQGTLDWTNVPAAVIFVFALTIGSYYGFWKTSGIAGRIETATNIT